MFTNREAMTIAATSIGLAVGADEGDRQTEGREDRARKEAARQEVLEAMNELEDARKKAGLPPKVTNKERFRTF